MTTGLTLDQFREIVEFARAFHEYGKFYDEGERTAIKMLYPKWKNMSIKYITSRYDSVDNTIWYIEFIGGLKNKAFNTNDNDTPLFDRVMAYLKGGEE
ncbi:hypothetical protein [Leptospira johnsonii]|nr:hypothetical protein [Leptospira johnsonii]